MKGFDYWKGKHESQRLEEFSNDLEGLLWLKTKSIVRKELITEFTKINGINLTATKLDTQFVELFDILLKDIEKSTKILEEFINSENRKQIESADENKLVAELYKLQNFKWGGDHQNSLDKHLVSRYVKVEDPSYENLNSKFDSEIASTVKGYVLSSWYNHWSTVLIENIFKSHSSVLAAVGKIKNVDFFIDNIPFDLKVTYLPIDYMKKKRKEIYVSKEHDFLLKVASENDVEFTPNDEREKESKNIIKSFKSVKGNKVLKEAITTAKLIRDHRNEITYLKNKAKELSIPFDEEASDNQLFYSITKQMKDRNNEFCNDVLESLQNIKIRILKETQENPQALATWLYENQGEMRFGSENRLFLILVNSADFNASWELKRDVSELKPIIISYLDDFGAKDLNDLKVSFKFKGKPGSFTALTDVLFVVK